MKSPIPIIAIVGRPNVGKSTFFNKILGKSRAIVEDFPGVTRDRNYALVERFDVPFYIVDTGGFDTSSNDELSNLTKDQTILSVEEADAIIFMVDSKQGLSPDDEEVLKILRSHEKPFILLANKCDGKEQEAQTAEFYSLGVDEVIPCSALHGHGTNETLKSLLKLIPNYESLKDEIIRLKEKEDKILEFMDEKIMSSDDDLISDDDDDNDLDIYLENKDNSQNMEKKVVTLSDDNFPPVFDPEDDNDFTQYEDKYSLLPLPATEKRAESDHALSEDINIDNEKITTPDIIKIAIIGRPNVGKSTILNSLLGETRSITSSTAGTTRDSIHELLNFNNQAFELIDTAGMRKKGRIGDSVEKYSVVRSMRAISECDVAVVVLDASEGPSEQDAKIVGIAHEEGKGIVLAINKWDLVEKDHKSVKKFEQQIKDEFKFIPYAPMCFISAITGKRVNKILNYAIEVGTSRLKRVSTMSLNHLLRRELPRASTPSYRGRPLKLYYAAQVDTAPPRFMLVLNYPSKVHFSYLRFIKNVIRENYKFVGTDIKLVTKKRSSSKKRANG